MTTRSATLTGKEAALLNTFRLLTAKQQVKLLKSALMILARN